MNLPIIYIYIYIYIYNYIYLSIYLSISIKQQFSESHLYWDLWLPKKIHGKSWGFAPGTPAR